ncbi:MAG TPA: hypothetical protein VI039_04880 [Solirubrobacterales bacterium]
MLAAIAALAILAIPGADGAVAGPASSSELTFPSEEAHVEGSRASFWVECSSSEASTCNGTVTLTTSGKKHKVPFSVVDGTHQSLTVRLGAHSTAKHVVAVARTAQDSGGYVRSWGVLKLR